MTRKLLSVLVCVALLLATLACQLLAGPNIPAEPTATAEIIIEATPTEDTSAAATATSQAAEENAKATEEALALAATEDAAAKATDQANQRLMRTATAVGRATAQASSMYNMVEKLQQEGAITSTAGEYYTIEDFKESWAQLNWYQWWNTGYTPSDFVIRAHTAWESASKTANWFSAGCGFVFRASDVDNHYMIFLALDGNVYLHGYVDGKYREFGKGYAGGIDHLKGEADVILAAQGDHFVYYVNGQKVLDRKNSELVEGDLGLTLSSGTNKDYGTRCEITNIELWDLSEQ